MDPRRSNPPQRHLPDAMQPKTNAPAQNPRPSAPIPPVKWANNTAAAQRQQPGMTSTTSSSVPILSGQWGHDAGAGQPHRGGPHPPQRASALIPPVRMPNALGAVQPQLAASSQPKRSTAPIPSVRMPHAPRPRASSIQRMDADDDFEVPEEYRPRPLPTLWDWIKGPLRRREEYERQYPTQVATITDIQAPVPQQGVLVPGLVPQQAVLVRAPVDIGALLKKGPSEELSNALKEKYGAALGGQMARQMRMKPTTSEQTLKKEAEAKIRQRENENSSEDKWTGSSSGGLNTKGKTVSNKKQGTGQGFRAGDPARWHVHYDHVKWGTSTNTRINFTGRPKQTILTDFLSQQPQAGTVNRASWDDCYQWMQNNL
jgi:hypothetical protein